MTADPAGDTDREAPANHRARATAVEETVELSGARSACIRPGLPAQAPLPNVGGGFVRR